MRYSAISDGSGVPSVVLPRIWLFLYEVVKAPAEVATPLVALPDTTESPIRVVVPALLLEMPLALLLAATTRSSISTEPLLAMPVELPTKLESAIATLVVVGVPMVRMPGRLFSTRQFTIDAVATTALAGATRMPEPPKPAPLSVITESETNSFAAALGTKLMPNARLEVEPRKPRTRVLWTCSVPPPVKLMPLTPAPLPSMSRPDSVTVSVAAVVTVTPVAAVVMAASVWSQTMLIDFAIVTAPYSAVSTQVIAPPAAVLAIAPAKVRHGAARLHTAASLPFDATKVRAAWAWAGACERRTSVVAKVMALAHVPEKACPRTAIRGWTPVSRLREARGMA